jgi:hypothetical protein
MHQLQAAKGQGETNPIRLISLLYPAGSHSPLCCCRWSQAAAPGLLASYSTHTTCIYHPCQSHPIICSSLFHPSFLASLARLDFPCFNRTFAFFGRLAMSPTAPVMTLCYCHTPFFAIVALSLLSFLAILYHFRRRAPTNADLRLLQCDEARPACYNCKRFAVRCQFPAEPQRHAALRISTGSAGGASSARSTALRRKGQEEGRERTGLP